MPLFEYACTQCNEKREILVRSAEQARPPRCPVCGAAMNREWAPVAGMSKSSGGCSAPRGGFS